MRTCACDFIALDPMEWDVCRGHMQEATNFAWYAVHLRRRWWQIFPSPTVEEFRYGLRRMRESKECMEALGLSWRRA